MLLLFPPYNIVLETGQNRIVLALRERVRPVRPPLSDEEKSTPYNSARSWMQERIATGELVFAFKTFLGHGLTSEWHDGERPLENQISETLAVVIPILSGLGFYFTTRETTVSHHTSFTSIFPMFSPLNNLRNAAGAFSMPCSTVFFQVILPPRIHPEGQSFWTSKSPCLTGKLPLLRLGWSKLIALLTNPWGTAESM
jgi:hypothetical protein